MANRKIRMRPEGTNDYGDVLHPETTASQVIEEVNKRFMTDAERTKLAGIATGANNYVHPATHPASIITEVTNKRFMTDAERNKLANLSSSGGYEIIESVNLTSNASTVKFSNLPSTFSCFQILYDAVGDSSIGSGGNSIFVEIFNSSSQKIIFQNCSLSSFYSYDIRSDLVMPIHNQDSGCTLYEGIFNGDYRNGSLHVSRFGSIVCEYTTSGRLNRHIGFVRSTALNNSPITSISLRAPFATGSSFRLLGVK